MSKFSCHILNNKGNSGIRCCCEVLKEFNFPVGVPSKLAAPPYVARASNGVTEGRIVKSIRGRITELHQKPQVGGFNQRVNQSLIEVHFRCSIFMYLLPATFHPVVLILYC